MQDLQLALVISRLYESEFETASTYKKILQRHVLGQDKQVQSLCVSQPPQAVALSVGNAPFHQTTQCCLTLQHFLIHCRNQIIILCIFQILAHQDPFLRSMAHWVLEDYSRALDTLLEQPANSAGSGSTQSKCECSLCFFFFFSFFMFLYVNAKLRWVSFVQCTTETFIFT